MTLFKNGWLSLCALLAVLVFTGVMGIGFAEMAHADCDDSAVECACACHSPVMHCVQALSFVPQLVDVAIVDEPFFFLCLISSDIFRPPIG